MFPTYNVVDYTKNRYLLSKAVMKRARQINFIGDDNLVDYDGKIVSLAMKQVFDDEIKYLNPLEQKGES
jgi:DNA-directed RNA polymerase subunit omega